MGGIIDPERGALLYRKTTQVEMVESRAGDQLQRKRVKKVTDETTWIGKDPKQPLLIPAEEDVEPWHDEEVEKNPLYSSSDYISEFHNPLYSRRTSTHEGTAIAATEPIDDDDTQPLTGRAARGKPESGDHGQEYVDYLSAEPGLVDTLF